jgi:endonuclease/exonuclease/phosphatase family metal-dependent hydrolase
MEFVFLIFWIVTWAIIGMMITPLMYYDKGHDPSKGTSVGFVAGALGGPVLLLPLWVFIPRVDVGERPTSLPPTLRSILYFEQNLFRPIEAGLVGLFLIQGIRFVYTRLYAHASSADLVDRVANSEMLRGVPGVTELSTVQNEIVTVAVLLLLPLLALILGRWRIGFPMAVILVALGRSLALQTPDFEVQSAALVVGASLLYLALVIIRRPTYFPIMILLGLTLEQLIRAAGNTYDRTWQNDYTYVFAGRYDIETSFLVSLVAAFMVLLSLLVWYVERWETRRPGIPVPPRGVLNLWGGLALGGLLYLELTLLALPNVVARWSGVDYTGLVPLLLAATALPLVPEVRDIARRFAGTFEGAWRGWLWFLMLALLLVIGRRFDGLVAGVGLVIAQFLVGLTLWWLYQTGQPRRNITGISVLLGVIVYLALSVGDYFTYDYAYVRDLADPYQNVSGVLRSFRGMGLGLALVAALLLSIPMILTRKWIPWRGGRTIHTLVMLALVLAVSFAGATTAAETPVRRPINPDCLRVATYNIHGGYSQFFDPNLERVADLVELNGADIVLLQEVETGRMSSYGVDQVLWLARRLDMESAFFAQNEATQGLAVLSRVPIVDVEGHLLPSEGNQAAVMHVALSPERLISAPIPVELGDLHIYNAWLGFREAERDGQPVPDDQQDQKRQLTDLLNWIAARHSPNWTDRILLGGTFNFGPDSPRYAEVPMIDPFRDLREENAMTVYLVDGSRARYDYLWSFNVPFNGILIDNSREAGNASDHRSAILSINRREGITCQP